MPHTTYTESTLAQGRWVGHDEGRALNTDASNAQTVSATESVPSRHRRQVWGVVSARGVWCCFPSVEGSFSLYTCIPYVS